MIKATTMIIGEAASRSLRGSSVHHGNLGRSNSNGAGSVHANRTVDQMASAVSGVVPQDYLPSVYGSAEWQAAWADDSLVQQGKLITVRVCVLVDRLAILVRQIGQQPEHEPPYPPPRLDPTKPTGHPTEQLVQHPRPSLGCYAAAHDPA
jgi:hypothetical protein